MPLFGETLYNEGDDNIAFFLARLVESGPPAFWAEHRDHLERILLPSAEDLDRTNRILDLLDTYIHPETCPVDWLDWMLTEWWGWTLIPDGFPVANKRILLSHMHLHMKRRYTVRGIKELLLDFNVAAEVYDRPIYYKSYYTARGVDPIPLNIRVRVVGFLPFFQKRRTYYHGYWDNDYYGQTVQIITPEFVRSLCRWERQAGARIVIEFARSQEPLDEAFILDDTQVPVG